MIGLWISESYGESDETNSEVSQTDEVIPRVERSNRGVSFVTKTNKKGKAKVAMRIDIPATTPTRAIMAITSMLWEDLVNNPKKDASGGGEFVNKRKIQCAEKMIRKAFVELYKALHLLKTYRFVFYFFLFSCLYWFITLILYVILSIFKIYILFWSKPRRWTSNYIWGEFHLSPKISFFLYFASSSNFHICFILFYFIGHKNVRHLR